MATPPSAFDAKEERQAIGNVLQGAVETERCVLLGYCVVCVSPASPASPASPRPRGNA
ncbi:hypothetical protein N9L76_02490 [bacterium]|nr:hypothetical protein [bacterium]